MTDDKADSCPETIAAAFGVASDPAFGAVAPPLYLSTTYEFAGFEQPRAYDYGRAGNPTRDLLAEAIAKLEGGAGAVITASGMAAVDLFVSRLPAGAQVVAPHDCYGGTIRLLKARAELGQIGLRLVDQADAGAFASALRERPRLVLVETPGNPTLSLVDIDPPAKVASRLGGNFFVAIPARDMFVAMSIGPEAFANRLANRVSEDFRRLPYPISPEFFLVTRDGVAGEIADFPASGNEAA